MNYVLIYFLLITLLAFGTMFLDKRFAIQGKFRVPESRIFKMAILGGSFGVILGMYAFRHKTKHWYFKYGMPAIFAVQIAIGLFIYFKFF